ncbi:hypothetical protein [Leptolyngbya sp. FACHB-8]|uniref:hypothetical protein n=1 Tax=unclassified Leptolyngbya TaxID=2650499 RepID=UPI001684502A|nr:hypothetical protein [Leptolyngbya sp. FACHB-8]MBD1911280.1 hypothetical protein [Leptolyngbya sp. FACHB-8]
MSPAEDSKLEVIAEAAAQLREQLDESASTLVVQLPPNWQSEPLVKELRADGIELRFTGQPAIGTERALASNMNTYPTEVIELEG